MAGYGPMTTTTFVLQDMERPAAPVFQEITQVDNSLVRATIALPTTDSTGNLLSGITKITVAALPIIDGVLPFDGLTTMDEVLALLDAKTVLPVHVVLTQADAGQVKDVDFPVSDLGPIEFAAAVRD